MKPANRRFSRSQSNKGREDTSWEGVSRWYGKHIRGGEDNYQVGLIFPKLVTLASKFVKLAKLPNGAIRVLDVACGEGMLARELAKSGFKVTGIDLSPSLIAQAEESSRINKTDSSYRQDGFQGNKVSAGKAPSRLKFYVEDARNFAKGFKGEKFDLIFCILALQNIEEIEQVFAEVARVLAKNGRFVFVINHPAFRIPRQSGWGFDDERKLQYRRVDKYRTELKIPIQQNPYKSEFSQQKSAISWSFHRPLAAYFRALSDNGFAVINLEEWYSGKTSQPGKKSRAENTARREFPMFMMMECSVSK